MGGYSLGGVWSESVSEQPFLFLVGYYGETCVRGEDNIKKLC